MILPRYLEPIGPVWAWVVWWPGRRWDYVTSTQPRSLVAQVALIGCLVYPLRTAR